MTIKWDTLKTAEQLEQERHDSAAAQVRKERDKRMSATDFWLLPDAPEQPEGLLEYRQALRDISEQEGFPFDVEWPEL